MQLVNLELNCMSLGKERVNVIKKTMMTFLLNKKEDTESFVRPYN